VNERIQSKTIRLISADGKQVGIVPLHEALNVSREVGLDLVEVAPNSDPPVCRVMDYGKFRYQAQKKAQEARKKSKGGQLKEIKLRPHTEEHDLSFKLKNLKKFLEKKNKVKVTVFFRGREMAFTEAGVEMLNHVAESVGDMGTVEQPPTREAKNRMTMVVVPK
jgi:translation initiation factor IF-3